MSDAPVNEQESGLSPDSDNLDAQLDELVAELDETAKQLEEDIEGKADTSMISSANTPSAEPGDAALTGTDTKSLAQEDESGPAVTAEQAPNDDDDPAAQTPPPTSDVTAPANHPPQTESEPSEDRKQLDRDLDSIFGEDEKEVESIDEIDALLANNADVAVEDDFGLSQETLADAISLDQLGSVLETSEAPPDKPGEEPGNIDPIDGDHITPEQILQGGHVSTPTQATQTDSASGQPEAAKPELRPVPDAEDPKPATVAPTTSRSLSRSRFIGVTVATIAALFCLGWSLILILQGNLGTASATVVLAIVFVAANYDVWQHLRVHHVRHVPTITVIQQLSVFTRRLCCHLNQPLTRVSSSTRNLVGGVALLTLFYASVVLIGKLVTVAAGW